MPDIKSNSSTDARIAVRVPQGEDLVVYNRRNVDQIQSTTLALQSKLLELGNTVAFVDFPQISVNCEAIVTTTTTTTLPTNDTNETFINVTETTDTTTITHQTTPMR